MHGPYRVIRNASFPLRRFDSGTTLNLFKDGGASAAATATPAETPGSSGVYFNVLTATEMTCDHLCYKGAAGDARSDGFLIPEPAIDSGVASAGTTTTMTLRAAAPSFDLRGMMVEIVRATGKDQAPRLIKSYDTGTKIATVNPPFTTAPDNTSIYIVKPPEGHPYLNEFWTHAYKTGTVASGSTTSVIKTDLTGLGASQLATVAIMPLGTVDDGIMRTITAYNTATGDIAVDPPYAAAPTAGDRIAVFGTTG